MAKRIDKPDDTTSHNRYEVFGHSRIGTDRVSNIDSASREISELALAKLCSTIPNMSPYYLYSVREVSAILHKAEDTIRKEARLARIGTCKEGRYWFNANDVQALEKSFAGKRKDYLHRQPKEVFNLSYALFQRITAIEHMVKDLIADRERFSILFYEWFTKMEDWRMSVEKWREGRDGG